MAQTTKDWPRRMSPAAKTLVHEAMSTPLMVLLQDGATQVGRPNVHKLMVDIVDYHSTPEEAAEVARDAKVRYLLLNHIAPPLPIPGMEKAFLGKAPDLYEGPIRVGADGDLISLPVGGRQVNASKLF